MAAAYREQAFVSTLTQWGRSQETKEGTKGTKGKGPLPLGLGHNGDMAKHVNF